MITADSDMENYLLQKRQEKIGGTTSKKRKKREFYIESIYSKTILEKILKNLKVYFLTTKMSKTLTDEIANCSK